MYVYRYRSIEAALRDIKEKKFHFASVEELNDPMEGYTRVYWKGDRAAWEGLFKNYICSCHNTILNYLLGASDEELWLGSVLNNIQAFKKIPIGKIYDEIEEELLSDEDVLMIASAYGDRSYKCYVDELRLILQSIHYKTIEICITSLNKHSIISDEESGKVLRVININMAPGISHKYPITLENEDEGCIIASIVEKALSDTIEWKIISQRMFEAVFLYGDKQSDSELDDSVLSCNKQYRNWLEILVNYPKIYVNGLRDMIFPNAFFVCFSGENNNSVMWGNYADHHRGVCLVYDAEDTSEEANAGLYQSNVDETDAEKNDNSIETNNKEEKEYNRLKPRKVVYGGDVIERNFFESLGTMTYSQMKLWLTGKNGKISECIKTYEEEKRDEYVRVYWENFYAKNYRKMEAWGYENEYRIHIDNTFYEYTNNDIKEEEKGIKKSVNQEYDPRILKGVIFGIKTSEYDKSRIVKALSEDELFKGITYFQAEFDEKKQIIAIRKKLLLNT